MSDTEILAVFSVPPPVLGRDSTTPRQRCVREMRRLGWFGPEGELDREALANAYGLDTP